jgi:lysyl endopeptidase
MKVRFDEKKETPMKRGLFLATALLLLASSVFAAEPVLQLGPAVYQAAPGANAKAALSDVLMSSGRLGPAERHDLGPLNPAERQRLRSDDGVGGPRALKVGISRELPRLVGFDQLPASLQPGSSTLLRGGLLENSGGNYIWTAGFRSPGAGAVRLHLEADLPAGARMYVYSGSGEVHGPYGIEQFTDGTLWTNTIYDDEIFLEVQLLNIRSGARLRVLSLVHIEHESFAPTHASLAPSGTECFIDATCVSSSEFTGINDAIRAIAQLVYQKGGDTFVCSGGLLNNTRQDFTPYFLTANHCFDSAASAASLEATWMYRTANCVDPNIRPNRQLFPRTLGSTIMTTAASSDFTLVRLNSNPPSGSVFLGWDAQTNVASAAGTQLFRIHHPQGVVQYYARHSVNTTSGTCQNSPRSHFIYSTDTQGGTAGGSSGSPVLLADLRVVGQLFGSCGSNLDDDCDRINNRTVDGALRASFPQLAPFLSPGSGGTPAPCVPSATTACMLNNRFQVQVRYRGAFDNNPADTNALKKSVTGFSNPNYETAFFYFNSENNIEMLVKLLDQGNTDGQGRPTIAVLFGSATPLRVELTITDTVSGAVKSYRSDFGQMRGTTDFTAFVK